MLQFILHVLLGFCLAAPKPAPVAGAPQHLGCWRDNGNRALSAKMTSRSDMTVELCNDICKVSMKK